MYVYANISSRSVSQQPMDVWWSTLCDTILTNWLDYMKSIFLIDSQHYSSFISISATGSLIARYTNAANIIWTVTIAAVAPITVEPCDRYLKIKYEVNGRVIMPILNMTSVISTPPGKLLPGYFLLNALKCLLTIFSERAIIGLSTVPIVHRLNDAFISL